MNDDDKKITDIFLEIMRKQIEGQTVRRGDYFVDDLLYCGRCREPRRRYEDVDGTRILVVCQCGCERAAEELEKERKRKRETERRLYWAEIPKRYENASFSTWDVTDGESAKIMVECKNFVDDFQSFRDDEHLGLLFYGNLGNGKTFAACAVARALIERGFNAVFVSVSEFISLKDEEAENMRRKMDEADLVILDDVGAERSTSFGAEKMYNLINGLYGDEKCVIATTNYTMAELKSGARTVNRLLEMCHPIQFSSQNLRNKTAADRYDRIRRRLDP